MGPQKRILIFSTAYLPFVGGAEIAVKEITDRVTEYEFSLVTARLSHSVPRTEQLGRVRVYRLGCGIPSIDKIFLALIGPFYARRLYRKESFACVWAIMASYGGYAASRFARQCALPLLLTLQEGDSIEHIDQKVRWRRRAFHHIFMAANALQAISQYLLQWGKAMGFAGPIAMVVPNGVDTSVFIPSLNTERAAIRKQWGYAEDLCVLITVSRLVKKNGIENLLRALSLAPADTRLVICGTGPLEQQLRVLVHELALQERVQFVGHQTHETVARFVAASDIFVRPSLSEGLGNAFLEAMAVGVPVIGSAVGGIPDFLTDGVTGIVCNPHDPQSIADSIQRLMQLPEKERETMTARASALVHERFTWDKIAKQMKTVFDTLCMFS